MTGHLLGAVGAIEAIACIKAVQHDVIPPTINSMDIEPAFKYLFYLTLLKAQKKKINYTMSNTFGFSVHIATAIFKKYA